MDIVSGKRMGSCCTSEEVWSEGWDDVTIKHNKDNEI
jgi:hypothetical protein